MIDCVYLLLNVSNSHTVIHITLTVPEETHERLYRHAKVQARNISHLKQTLDMMDQEQREFRARSPHGRGSEVRMTGDRPKDKG